MMTIFSVTFFGLCTVAAAAESPAGGDYGTPRLLVSAPADPASAHLSWPKIVATPEGILVLAYSAGKGHNIGGSGPAVSRSTDGGASFSPPQLLRRFPDDDPRYRDCGNLALGVADDGAVVLLAMAYAGNEQNTVLGWRSADGGANWAPVDTTALAENKTGSVYGHILLVPGEGLVVFGHYRQPSTPPAGIWMSTSRDHGRTWEPPRVVTKQAYFEPAFTFTQGRFVGLLRLANDTQARRYDQAVSDDRGQTWQIRSSDIAIPAGQPGRQPSPFITTSPGDPAKLYALQSIRGELEESRGRIYLWTADARQLQWRREGLVVRIPAAAENLADWSYPWMTPLDDRTWLLVFYAGSSRGANAIYGLSSTFQPQ